jgi:predicted transcriptional regulator YheO
MANAHQDPGAVDSSVRQSHGPAAAALGYRPHRALVGLMPIADGMARVLGPNYEIVLHDLRHPDRSVCHIAGTVTSRVAGAPATNVLLETLRRRGDLAEDVFNYATTVNGTTIRSSIIFLREGSQVIGAFCVNVDVSAIARLQEELARLIGVDAHEPPRVEAFDNTVGELLEDLLAAAFSSTGVRRTQTTPDERLQLVAALDEQGAFQVKGSVELVARELGVSKYTIYTYLHKLRGPREPERQRPPGQRGHP